MRVFFDQNSCVIMGEEKRIIGRCFQSRRY